MTTTETATEFAIDELLSDGITNTPPSFVRAILKAASDPAITSFAGGLPNPISFPQEKLMESMQRVVAERGPEAFQYSMTAGIPELREWIAERYNHRFYPGYITLGMDATVSWGGPEFRFKNNTGYPIRIDVSYANSKLTVSVVGTKTDDTYVKMTHEVLSTKGYETEYVESADLAPGAQKQKQNGYTGYEVVTYRNVYDGSGNLVSSKQEAKSSYKSRNRIMLVGPAAAGGGCIPCWRKCPGYAP